MSGKVPREFVPTEEISGKKLIPALAIGCLLFGVIMLLGTWGAAKLTTPMFLKMEKDREAALAKAGKPTVPTLPIKR